MLVDFIKRQKSFDNIVVETELMSLGMMKSFLEGDVRILVAGRGSLDELACKRFCAELDMLREGSSGKCLLMRRALRAFDEKCGEPLGDEVTDGQYKSLAKSFLRENGGGFYKK